jgi:hypothetical protein
MTTKHTQGPWVIAPVVGQPEKAGQKIIFGQEYVSVCQTIDNAGKGREETMSNAALIAAAPDLLLALERVLMAIEWTCTGDRLTQEQQADLIRAAIAKAKGEG